MTKEELKPQTEDMIYQILKLVGQLNDKESYELKIELACSIITAAIDFEKNDLNKTLLNLQTALTEVSNITAHGVVDVILNKRGYKEL